jgi:hypothetical protein
MVSKALLYILQTRTKRIGAFEDWRNNNGSYKTQCHAIIIFYMGIVYIESRFLIEIYLMASVHSTE